MGGFVLLNTAPGEDRSAAQAAALAIVARSGMPAPQLIRGKNYILAIYPKRQSTEPALQQFPNGDFVYACGTLVYENMVGKPAAAAFYRDSIGQHTPRDQAIGHYAVLIRKGGETTIVPDAFGGFLVYHDAARRIASSSFLAVASALDRVTLSTQGAFEYVFNGVVSGNATVFDEVLLAPVNATIAVDDQGLKFRPYSLPIPTVASTEPFEAVVERSMQLLDHYFVSVAKSFGDHVTCALSGGYDSRLILAMLRRHGIRPRVYVYGPPGDKDVSLARAIAEGEGFASKSSIRKSSSLSLRANSVPSRTTISWLPMAVPGAAFLRTERNERSALAGSAATPWRLMAGAARYGAISFISRTGPTGRVSFCGPFTASSIQKSAPQRLTRNPTSAVSRTSSRH
jgi:asparagine synthase (glutamine-hydrolysing)